MFVLRKAFLIKKAAYFWTFSQKGGGVQPEPKSFGVAILVLSSGQYLGGGWGAEQIPKVLR